MSTEQTQLPLSEIAKSYDLDGRGLRHHLEEAGMPPGSGEDPILDVATVERELAALDERKTREAVERLLGAYGPHFRKVILTLAIADLREKWKADLSDMRVMIEGLARNVRCQLNAATPHRIRRLQHARQSASSTDLAADVTRQLAQAFENYAGELLALAEAAPVRQPETEQSAGESAETPTEPKAAVEPQPRQASDVPARRKKSA